MKQNISLKSVLICLFIFLNSCNQKEKTNEIISDIRLDINSKTITKIQPTMYGIFYEDINFSADGGLYAELIKNGSFEFPDAKMGWKESNSIKHSLNKNSGIGKVTNYIQAKANKRYSHFVVNDDSKYQIINEGFRGIGLHENKKYLLSFSMANAKGIKKVNFALVDTLGRVIAKKSFDPNLKGWENFESIIIPNKTVEKAKLKLTFDGTGSIDMDLISIFPQKTWKNRKKGLRNDLVQLLDDIKPGFLRFPGGCIVEGRTLAQRYQWKKTVGAIEDREVLVNRWNNEFSHRPTPDYFQSFGLGFFEYFQLAEDMKAEPIPIVSCGMACQFNTGELVPIEDLVPYIQDALDLIEFANGDLNTVWGKLRNDMGHPKPFNMKYLGVGNEQWGPEYFDRYKVFAGVLNEKHPEITLVSTPGPLADGDLFEYGWDQIKQLNVPLVDEHYYKSPEWFLENANRYDSYDRNGPKVFAGEFAAQSVDPVSPKNRNTWYCALSEAAFMTGLERNADVVYMSSYAPLMAHVDGWQWTPDMIWFNNLKSYGTPNYYVQKLFSNNKGTDLIKITQNGKSLIGQNKLYASATKDIDNQEVIIKVVNSSDLKKNIDFNIDISILKKAKVVTLSAENLDAENSFENPTLVSPIEKEIELGENQIKYTFIPNSLTILKLKINTK